MMLRTLGILCVVLGFALIVYGQHVVKRGKRVISAAPDAALIVGEVVNLPFDSNGNRIRNIALAREDEPRGM